jgi:hypothetical protein
MILIKAKALTAVEIIVGRQQPFASIGAQHSPVI